MNNTIFKVALLDIRCVNGSISLMIVFDKVIQGSDLIYSDDEGCSV